MRAASGKSGWRRRACIGESGRQGGFTYLGVLALVAIMGVTLAAAGEVWHTAQKREKEQELLFIGEQFRRAIGLYYDHTPAGRTKYPANLEDLLKDPRYPSTQRYLRKMYRDPINGGTEWGAIKKPDGGIYGVYSLSEEEPIKKSNFRLDQKDFEGRTKYSDWIFVHVPKENSIRTPLKR